MFRLSKLSIRINIVAKSNLKNVTRNHHVCVSISNKFHVFFPNFLVTSAAAIAMSMAQTMNLVQLAESVPEVCKETEEN